MVNRFIYFFSFLFFPLAASGLSPENAALSGQIDLLVSEHDAEGVDSALMVQDATTGEVLYARQADALLNPASNAKLLTTMAALSFLGPDFRFKTQLLGDAEPKKGTLNTLILKGFGDPTLTTDRLEGMVVELKAKGIKVVENIRVDESYFDHGDFPGRFEGRQREALFNTSVGALVLDHNQVEVIVTPGGGIGERAEVALNPPLEGFTCEGEIVTRGRRPALSVRKSPEAGAFRLAVNGSIPLRASPQSYRMSCDDPGHLAGMRLVAMLRRQGIQGPENFLLAPAPEKSKVLVESKSPPLSEVILEINKKSDNFMAEQLAKVLGAEYGGPPGTTPKGTRAIIRELHATGVDTQGIFLENGSGLSRESRIKVKTLVGALQKAYDNSRLRQDLISSLSILGVDGTLRRKFRNTDLAGRFFGKTGTLSGVSSLSGFAFPMSGIGERAYIFAYIINGHGKGFWQQRELMRKVLELLLQQ